MFSVACHVFIVLAFACLTPAAARAERIRTSIPGLNLNYLSVLTAGAKGFFKDEGLENETIVIGGPAGRAAAGRGADCFCTEGGHGVGGGGKSGAPEGGKY